MSSKTFIVMDICCNNCAQIVKYQVGQVNGVHEVEVDITTKAVTVRWGMPATWQQIGASLEESGYPPGPELFGNAKAFRE